MQHCAALHAPLQHSSPPGHWALLVHGQLVEEHWWVWVSQHCPARQSELEQQPEMQLPLQQIWPPAHWLLWVQPHAVELHCRDRALQHSPAVQSPSE